LPSEIDYEEEFEKLKVKFVQIKEQLDDVNDKYKNCEINLRATENNQLYNEWSEFWEKANQGALTPKILARPILENKLYEKTLAKNKE
jgi:uncharacterized protein YbaA (DUF1428 family)